MSHRYHTTLESRRPTHAPSELNCDHVFHAVNGNYLVLLSPNVQLPEDRQALQSFVDLVPSVSPETVEYLIQYGISWRERIIGVTLAAAMDATLFSDAALASLQNPCGYEVTPAFALLCLAYRDVIPPDIEDLLSHLDPHAAHGEIGWGIRKLHHLLKISHDDPGDVSPVTGLHFHFYLDSYEWLARNRPGQIQV